MWKWLRQVKTKILVGYLLLAVIVFLSLFAIYTQVRRLYLPDETESLLRTRHSLISSTLSHLYQSESLLHAFIVGNDNFKPYLEKMGQVSHNLDSLKQLSPDSLQHARVDSILVLLQEKDNSMRMWLRSLRKTTADKLYQENLSKALFHRAETQQPSVDIREKEIKRDTVVVTQTQKNFFKRLAYAFAPQKNIPEKVITTTEHHLTDTLRHNYNEQDTISRIFKDVQENVGVQRREWADDITASHAVLAANNRQLVHKINDLLTGIDREELQRAEKEYLLREDVMQRTGTVVAVVALISLLVIVAFVIFIWRDISRSNLYRRELEEANEYAESLLAAREQLMLTITHDIKAPLGSIIGYIELMDSEPLSPVIKEYLDSMKSSSRHLLRLVTDLVDYHRLSLGKMEVHPVTFDLQTLFSDVANEFRPLCDRKLLQLKVDIAPSVNGEFRADAYRLRQIIENLMSNAVKFTPQGYVSLSAEVTDDTKLRIEISDSGVGISKSEHEKIFQEFVRLQSAGGAEGVGLGLSITQKLIQLLCGSLRLKSKPNEGSRFVVAVPIEKIGDMQPANKKEEKDYSKYASLRILLVDDDPLQLKMTAALLRKQGIDPICCATPDAVFEHLINTSVDVLMTDVQMPQMDGIELVARVREQLVYPDLYPRFIALTARADVDALACGFSACVHKPFSGEELLGVISQVVDGHPVNILSAVSSCEEVQGEYDFSEMLAFADDELAAKQDILSSFIAETTAHLDKIDDALAQDQLETVRQVAHKMLPLMKMVGAAEAARLLAEMEHWNLKVPEMIDARVEMDLSVRQMLWSASALLEKIK